MKNSRASKQGMGMVQEERLAHGVNESEAVMIQSSSRPILFPELPGFEGTEIEQNRDQNL